MATWLSNRRSLSLTRSTRGRRERAWSSRSRHDWSNNFRRSTVSRSSSPSPVPSFLCGRVTHSASGSKQPAALCYNQDQDATNYLRESKYCEEDRPVPLRRFRQGRQAPLRAAPHVHLEGGGDGLGRTQGARPEPRVSRGVLQLAEGRAAGAHRRGDFEVRLREGRGPGRDLASQEGRQRGDRNGLRPRGRVDRGGSTLPGLPSQPKAYKPRPARPLL